MANFPCPFPYENDGFWFASRSRSRSDGLGASKQASVSGHHAWMLKFTSLAVSYQGNSLALSLSFTLHLVNVGVFLVLCDAWHSGVNA